MIQEKNSIVMKIGEMVRKSYDKMGRDYHTFRDNNKMNGELEKFASLLPVKGSVLDVASGAGIPAARFLVKRGFKVLGVDISQNMVDLAKENVPEADFLRKDMLELDFDDETFDGILCVYSLWHVPRKEHFSIFKNFNRMLKKNGVMMINTGISASEGKTLFFGEPMFWSNYPPKKTLQLIQEAGFVIDFEGILRRGGEFQYWIFALKK
jgi:ubiquinone/menaquinone biosynthesis C-methylase UbiE